MGASGWTHLDVSQIDQETDKALRIVLEDGRAFWIPKSQIADADNYEVGDTNCTVSITDWIAEQKGLT